MAQDVEKVDVTRHRPEAPARTPAVDLLELENEFVLTAEMPGVARDGVDVTVEEGALTLRGVVAEAPAGKPDHQEFAHADFERAFALSGDIDPAGISAEMNDGVLTLHLAKRASAKIRKIEIKSLSE